MDDVSVEHIGSLYDYCHNAESFLNDIESLTRQILNDLEIILAESNIQISRIQDVLDSYKCDIDKVQMELDDLREQLEDLEDEEDDDEEEVYENHLDERIQLYDEINRYKIELSELQMSYNLCEDDINHAKDIRQAINNQIYTIRMIIDEAKTSIKSDTESSIFFIKKYAGYLQDIISSR